MKTRRYENTTVREAMARIAGAMTSFDELAAASPSLQFDLKSTYPLSRLRDSIEGISGGDVVQEDGLFRVFTTTDGASEILFRSLERGRYIAGFDMSPGMGVAVPTMPVGAQDIEWGYTDFVNGFIVGIDSTSVYCAFYVDGVRTQFTRIDDWDYPLDTYDPTFLTIYQMPFRWYGAGPFRLHLSAVINGSAQMYPVHTLEIENPGETITRDANLPLAIRIRNNGETTALNALVAGRQVMVRGDYKPYRRISSIARVTQTIGTDWVAVTSFRQKQSVAFDSITIKLQGMEFLSTEEVQVQVLIDTDLTGGTWIPPDRTDNGAESATEFNISATGFVNGIKIVETLVPGGGGSKTQHAGGELPDLDLPGGGQTHVLIARALKTSADLTTIMKVREEW